MGLFHILKNGLTIEKKKVQPESAMDSDTENLDEENFETSDGAEPVANPIAAETTTMPSAQPTLEEQRMEAASVLLGDSGLTHGATPSLIQVAQPTPVQSATQTTTVESQPTQQFFNTHNNLSNNFDNALLGQVSANQNLLVIAPQTSAEISTILTNLANGNACIVSLARFALPEAQRFLDYICGFVNAIGGMIMQKTSSEYILAPKGVNIKNS
ncbi:MAG: cell division protein SepF [Clostridia bacterium]|nr:cell division protein SepF [Clostridia bacterium]